MHHLGLKDVLLIEQSREQAGPAWPAPIFAKPQHGQEALHFTASALNKLSSSSSSSSSTTTTSGTEGMSLERALEVLNGQQMQPNKERAALFEAAVGGKALRLAAVMSHE